MIQQLKPQLGSEQLNDLISDNVKSKIIKAAKEVFTILESSSDEKMFELESRIKEVRSYILNSLVDRNALYKQHNDLHDWGSINAVLGQLVLKMDEMYSNEFDLLENSPDGTSEFINNLITQDVLVG